MLRLYSDKRAESIIERHSGMIEKAAADFHVPEAAIKAILFMELGMMDMFDIVIDLIVGSGLFTRIDSSTGHAQIFARTAIIAINHGLDHHICDMDKLGIKCDHRLDENEPGDIRSIWRKLHRDRMFNIEAAALVLIYESASLFGETDLKKLNDDQLKLVFTRYNANTGKVTRYGQEAFRHYKRYLAGSDQ